MWHLAVKKDDNLKALFLPKLSVYHIYYVGFEHMYLTMMIHMVQFIYIIKRCNQVVPCDDLIECSGFR